MKKNYFPNHLALLFDEQVESTGIKLAEYAAEGAKMNAFGNSRYWLHLQTIMTEEINTYSEKLLNELSNSTPEHSPVRKNDYEQSQESINEFKEHLIKLYSEKASANSSFGGSRPPIDQNRFERQASIGSQRIEGAKLEFRSKRSFWKWAFGDLRKRLWSVSLAGIGAFIYFVIQRVISFISQ
jgi:hypothetical protein